MREEHRLPETQLAEIVADWIVKYPVLRNELAFSLNERMPDSIAAASLEGVAKQFIRRNIGLDHNTYVLFSYLVEFVNWHIVFQKAARLFNSKGGMRVW